MTYRCVWLVFLLVTSVNCANNLSCYQCSRNANEECGREMLLPCPAYSDRCVTHISKDDQKGYLIKRECGLGPCAFEDDMANRGLGLDACDRTKDDYFCVFCCRTSGCNKNASSPLNTLSNFLFLEFICLSVHMILLFTYCLI